MITELAVKDKHLCEEHKNLINIRNFSCKNCNSKNFLKLEYEKGDYYFSCELDNQLD